MWPSPSYNFSYTYIRLNDNQFGESNYYASAPGLQNNYTVVRDSPYYNPDQEYGRSLLDSPHKIVLSPIFQLPFGEGKKYFSTGKWADILLGGNVFDPGVRHMHEAREERAGEEDEDDGDDEGKRKAEDRLP